MTREQAYKYIEAYYKEKYQFAISSYAYNDCETIISEFWDVVATMCERPDLEKSFLFAEIKNKIVGYRFNGGFINKFEDDDIVKFATDIATQIIDAELTPADSFELFMIKKEIKELREEISANMRSINMRSIYNLFG